MCKITQHNQTWVGNNEDSWRIDSKIWFRQGEAGKYGVCYVGHENMMPQGGMNRAGLVFDAFSIMPRPLKPGTDPNKITDPYAHIQQLMQTCATVEQVREFIRLHGRYYNNGMYLFVDKTGKYLVAEPDTCIIGTDPNYLLSNFCPSQTPDLGAVKISRYKRGQAYLALHAPDSGLAYTLALMDTMHECRPKLGDGTTYTSLYNLNTGNIYLYFYHNYKQAAVFNLDAELARGNHEITMSALFAPNAEYEAFVNFITPFNNNYFMAWMLIAGAFAGFSSVYFTRTFVAAKRRNKAGQGVLSNASAGQWTGIVLAIANIVLCVFIYVLLTNKGMFYFPAPYRTGYSLFTDIMAFFPLLLLVLFPVLAYQTYKSMRQPGQKNLWVLVFALNTIAFALWLCLFVYWGFLAYW
ncbi:MAG: hypothetical protein V4543_13815 [Bacteroidota bacterium]